MRGQTVATRTFWWDRTPAVDAAVDPLKAVIFDLDAIAVDDGEGELTPRSGLIDLVMDLFVTGTWVAVVSSKSRREVAPLLRELIGDGLVETVVTADDADSTKRIDLYELALWELGIGSEEALAMAGSEAGRGAAVTTGLATVLITAEDIADHDVSTAAGCQREHLRWWISRKRAVAA
jgi:beta-phosphoglucomutase-like phosphatase (HAD superfamily)